MLEEELAPRLLYPDSAARFRSSSGDVSPVEVESGTHSLTTRPPPDRGVWLVSWKRPPTSDHDDTSEDDPRTEGGGGLVVEEGSSVFGNGGRSGGLSASTFTFTFPGFPLLTEEEERGKDSEGRSPPGSAARGFTSTPSSRGIGNGSCALLFSSEMKFSVFDSTGGAGRAFLVSRLCKPFSLLLREKES